MIKSLKLDNFMKLSRIFNFDKGTTFVVGENGSGKTTVTNAILFALYGPSSLPVNKDDLLTYGETSGSVTISIYDDGNDITITRPLGRGGKPTATLNKQPPTIGAKEVDAFVQEHFGNIESFTISHIARQQEIASIIRLEPRIRKKVFSEFIGLEIIDAAIATNGTVPSISPIDQNELSAHKKELEVVVKKSKKVDVSAIHTYNTLQKELARSQDYDREEINKQIKSIKEEIDKTTKLVSGLSGTSDLYERIIGHATHQTDKSTCMLCGSDISNKNIIDEWKKTLNEMSETIKKNSNKANILRTQYMQLTTKLSIPQKKDVEERLKKLGKPENQDDLIAINQRVGDLRGKISFMEKQLEAYNDSKTRREIRTILQEFKQYLMTDMINSIQGEMERVSKIITSDWEDPVKSITINPDTIAIFVNERPINLRSTGQSHILCAILRFCISIYWNRIQGKTTIPFIVMDSPFDALSEINFGKMIDTISSISNRFHQIIITSHRTCDNPGEWKTIEL